MKLLYFLLWFSLTSSMYFQMNPNEVRVQKRKRRFEAGVLHSLKDANELKLVTHFLDAKDLLHLMQTKKEFRKMISGSFERLFNHLDQEFTVNFGVYFVSEMPTNKAKLLSYFNMFCKVYGTDTLCETCKNKKKAKQGFMSALKTYLKRIILRRVDNPKSNIAHPEWKRNKECTEAWQEIEQELVKWQNIHGEIKFKIRVNTEFGPYFSAIILENSTFPLVIETDDKLVAMSCLDVTNPWKDDNLELSFFNSEKQVIPSTKKLEVREELGKVVSNGTPKNFRRYIRKFDIGESKNE